MYLIFKQLKHTVNFSNYTSYITIVHEKSICSSDVAALARRLEERLNVGPRPTEGREGQIGMSRIE